MILSALSIPLKSLNLKGCGTKKLASLSKLGAWTLKDLLSLYPRDYSDRSVLLTLNEITKTEGSSGTVKVKVLEHRLIGNRYKKFLKVLIQDETGQFGALLCFNRNFLKNTLTIGDSFFITGKFSKNYNEVQSSSFEIEPAGMQEEFKGKILPIYPLTEGLTQKHLREWIKNVLNHYCASLEEELPLWCLQKYHLMGIQEAITNIHFPKEFKAYTKARRRLIFEEFFFQKLFLLERKESLKNTKKERSSIPFHYKKAILQHLPFALMNYQLEALNAIEEKLFCEKPFSILLQGDVGAGKTIVALLAMLDAIEAGYQAALMVPTEVLAIQHYKTIRKLTQDLWLDVAILKGNMPKKERDNILSGLKNGEIKIVVGTHALFSEDVLYKNLGLAIIDEQHRFGVEQRYKLLSKGNGADLLLMTATPIPQSLALSLYGDLDLITMRGKITGRLPVKTWVVEEEAERLTNMHTWIKKTIQEEDGRAIFVYPLIQETEGTDLKNLMEEYKKLREIYQAQGCEAIHSGTPAEEKERIINEFRSGTIRVLAATTVVEVGLDIPNANIIVVENADNFGLSTLHQLRGRVGRNNKQGYMILIADSRVTESGKQRLDILRTEHDGFKIAEQDLLMRGPGDFIGNRQSGIFNIRLADIKQDMEILLQSSEAADILMKTDKHLESADHIITKQGFYQRMTSFTEAAESF